MSLSRKFNDLKQGTVEDPNKTQSNKNNFHKIENKAKRNKINEYRPIKNISKNE